jgi:hypothetical protein
MRRTCLAPPAGRRPADCAGQVKTKTKTVLRRKDASQLAGSACLPLVGPESWKTSERRFRSLSPLTSVQAHLSMRICSGD